ncbi:MAG: DUF190 domain-containing protein [Rhodocyclaceae bacterium]
MKGFQLIFFTQQNHQHGGLPLCEWLMREARAIGVQGATVMAASEGYGRSLKLHAAHFFELADQPVQVTMLTSEALANTLLHRLREEGLKIFYARVPIEFGSTEDWDDPINP